MTISALRRLPLLAAVAAQTAGAATLDVTVQGVRDAHGHVLVTICPRETFLAPRCEWRAAVPSQPGAVTLHFQDIPPGVYAAQAYQDANDNHTIDRNWIGIPTEPIGFSNDAPFRFGPPRFDDAAFRLTPYGGRIEFKLRLLD